MAGLSRPGRARHRTLSETRAATKPSRSWHNGDHDQRRRLIVQTALRLLHRHGIEQVTMRRVAADLGVGAMTLYTYVDGQDELRRAMIREGFAMLSGHCEDQSTLDGPAGWRGSAGAYLQFAIEHPKLYHLMFSEPMTGGEEDLQTLRDGIAPLIQRITERLRAVGLEGDPLQKQAGAAAARFWVALHGLASLAIADRLAVTGQSLDDILDDLLHRVAPD